MKFEVEMMSIFDKVINAQIEPQDWQQWWNEHEIQLRKTISPGDFLRMKPNQRNWSDNIYISMCYSQEGITRYMKKQGIVVSPSRIYEDKQKQRRQQQENDAMLEYKQRVNLACQNWKTYCQQHNVLPIKFDWEQYLGILPFQSDFSHPKANHQETINLFKQRLKENIKHKMIPLIKAYGMKAVGPRTFVKEENGIVTFIQFIGYFRGGGFADVQFYLCPLYALGLEKLDLPRSVFYTDHYISMQRHWSSIEYIYQDISIKDIDQEFNYMLAFFAEDVFPHWHQINSLDTYFCNERKEYLNAMLIGPPNLKHPRILPLWNDTEMNNDDSWGINDYLYGVWDLLCGREEAGYKHLEDCLKHEESYLKWCEESKRNPNYHLYQKDPQAVLYHNAHCFLDTKYSLNKAQAIQETYNDVCELMRCYHRLKKRTKYQSQ